MPLNKYLIDKNTLSQIGNTIKKVINADNNISMNILEWTKLLEENYNAHGSYGNYQEILNNYIDGKLSGVVNIEASSVRPYAFYNFTEITKVNAPNCTTIGSSAFYSCTNLKEIYAPLCSSCNSAFDSKIQLKSLNLGLVISTTDKYGFTSKIDANQPLHFYKNSTIENVIMNGLTEIGSYAFQGCSALKTAEFNEVLETNTAAFSGCTLLAHIDLPKTSSIATQCFRGCKSLTTLNLPAATRTYDGAFSNCTSLTNVYAPLWETVGAKTFQSVTTLQSVTNAFRKTTAIFSKMSNLKYVSMSKAETINENAFFSCSNLEEIHIPEALTVGKNTFAGCEKLKAIDIPKVSTIGSHAFSNCKALSKFNAPKLTTIGQYLFRYCENLDWFNCDFSNVTKIDKLAFENCSKITIVDAINCKTLGATPFSGCENIEYVYMGSMTSAPVNTLPSTAEIIELPSCTSVIASAFKNYQLRSISIPSAKTIGNNAFEGCSNLTRIYLPNCTAIYKNAFLNCSKLSRVYLLSNKMVSPISAGAFSNTSTDLSIYVPNDLLDDYQGKYTNLSFVAFGSVVTVPLTIKDKIMNRICFQSTIKDNDMIFANDLGFAPTRLISGLYLPVTYYSDVYTFNKDVNDVNFGFTDYYSKNEYIKTSTYDPNISYYIQGSSSFYGPISITPDLFSISSYYTLEPTYVVASSFITGSLYYSYVNGSYVLNSGVTAESFPQAVYFNQIDMHTLASKYRTDKSYYYISTYYPVSVSADNFLTSTSYYKKEIHYSKASVFESNVKYYSHSSSIKHGNKSFYSIVVGDYTIADAFEESIKYYVKNGDTYLYNSTVTSETFADQIYYSKAADAFEGAYYIWNHDLNDFTMSKSSKYLYYYIDEDSVEEIKAEKLDNFELPLLKGLSAYTYYIE